MKMTKTSKWAAVVGGIILFLCSFLILINKVRNPGENINEEVYYVYDMTPNTDYTVTLIPNNYFNDRVLPSGGTYIRNYIESIDLDLKEEFQSSEDVSIKGTYQVDAEVAAALSSGTILWNKTYPLVEETTINNQTNNQIIEEKLEFDLTQYEREYQTTSAELGVTLSYTISIVMKGKLEVTTQYQSFEVPINTNVSMPMYSSMFTITTDNSSVQTDQFANQYSTPKEVSKPVVFLCIVGMLGGIALLGSTLFFVKEYSEEELKKKRMVQILTKNKSKLVELSSLPDMNLEQSFEVKTMDALIHISEDFNRPIFYIPDEETVVLRSLFFVIDRQEVYLYEAEEKVY